MITRMLAAARSGQFVNGVASIAAAWGVSVLDTRRVDLENTIQAHEARLVQLDQEIRDREARLAQLDQDGDPTEPSEPTEPSDDEPDPDLIAYIADRRRRGTAEVTDPGSDDPTPAPAA